MKTNKFVPGMVFKMTDHSNMGKTGERNCHNYIVIGYSYDNWIGNYQCMCITSMYKKPINWEVPVVVDDTVGYIVTDNIHSFTEKELQNGKHIGTVTSNRKISITDFLIFLHEMHLMRTIQCIGTEKYYDIVTRFDQYCRDFQILYPGVKEYRYVKQGVASTFDACYKYKPSSEVLSILRETGGEESNLELPPILQEEVPPEIIEIPESVEIEKKTTKEKGKTTKKENKKKSNTRKKSRKRVPRIMDGDDLIILNLLDTQAPRMIAKWNETDIRRAKILNEKYSSTTIQANSKRWKSPSSWSNVIKVISNMETSVDTTRKGEEQTNRDFCLPVSNWSDEKIRQFLDDTVNHVMNKRALCKYTKIPNYGDAKNFVANVRKYAKANNISY